MAAAHESREVCHASVVSFSSRSLPSSSLGSLAFGRLAPGTAAQDATPAGDDPSAGERVHVDLAVHFAWDPALIAHHWCKPVAGGFFECLIYASDDPDAPLVAVEEVVDEATYQASTRPSSGCGTPTSPRRPPGRTQTARPPRLEEAAAEAAAAGGAT